MKGIYTIAVNANMCCVLCEITTQMKQLTPTHTHVYTYIHILVLYTVCMYDDVCVGLSHLYHIICVAIGLSRIQCYILHIHVCMMMSV